MDEGAANQIDLTPESGEPRDNRYKGLQGEDVKVVIERKTEGEPEEVVARLLDISRGGAKLTVTACIPFEEAVRLKIDIPDLHVELVIAADVCWTRPADDGGWMLGCAFKPKLPEDALDQLAKGGYVDRRRHARTPLVLRATACWELGETSIPVRLQDASEGGFAMLCPQLGETGQRLLLHLCNDDGSPASIPAKIQWRLKTGDEYLIGCSFSNEKDFELLRGVAETMEEIEEEVELVIPTQRSPILMYGAVAATAFFTTSLYLLLQRATQSPRLRQVSTVQLDDHSVLEPESPGAPSRDAADSPEESQSAPPAEADPPSDWPLPTSDNAGQMALPPDSPYLLQEAEPLRLSDPTGPLSIDDALDGSSPPRFQSATEDAWPATLDWNNSDHRLFNDDGWMSDALEPAPSAPLSAPGQARASEDEFIESQPVSPPAELDLNHLDIRLNTDPAPPLIEPNPFVVEPVSPPSEPAPLVEPAPVSIDPTPTPGRIDFEPTSPPRPPQTLQDPKRAAELYYHATELYRRRDFEASASEFRRAAELDGTNALYVYLTALAEYESGQTTDARRSVGRAVELEQTHPVPYWGSVMRRYQGRARAWLEQARTEARAAE